VPGTFVCAALSSGWAFCKSNIPFSELYPTNRIMRSCGSTCKPIVSRDRHDGGYCWSLNFVLVDRDWLADRLSPQIRCTPGTDLVLLTAYMCPDSMEMDFSSSFFQHFWRGDSRNYQDLARAACSVPRKADQAPINSEFCWMQGPGTECGRSIGFDALLLSFQISRVLSFWVFLCFCPSGQNSGISNTAKNSYHGHRRTMMLRSITVWSSTPI